MPHGIELIARGLAEDGDRILFCRSVADGYLYLPGGHVEFGEPVKDALHREFLEETGLAVQVGRLALVAECSFLQRDRLRHEVNLLFHVKLPITGHEVRSQESAVLFVWHRFSELPSLPIRPDHIKSWLVTQHSPAAIIAHPPSEAHPDPVFLSSFVSA